MSELWKDVYLWISIEDVQLIVRAKCINGVWETRIV